MEAQKRTLLGRAVGYARRKSHWVSRISWAEQFTSIKTLTALRQFQQTGKQVLMVEPNAFHAEILPGFCKYFRDLGYEVTLLLRRANAKSGVFCRVPADQRPTCFSLAPWAMARFLSRLTPEKCNVVFVSSSYHVQEGGFFGLIFDYLGFIPQARCGYLLVEHHFPVLQPELERGRLEFGRVFLLSEHSCRNQIVPMLNPHYFGQVDPKPREGKTRFITVGSLSSRNRSPQQLLAAVQELRHQGIEDFEVRVIGRDISELQTKTLPPQVKILGALDYEALFRELEAAHFLLPLLDPANEWHRRYLSGETTGSRQLILGFTVIPIMHHEFATAYGFTVENSLLHENDGLSKGMAKAIAMNKEEFVQKRDNLKTLSRMVYAQSLENLRTTLETIRLQANDTRGERVAASASYRAHSP